MTLILLDDGTLDTVFMCERCKQELRYSECPREDDGTITNATVKDLEAEHDDWCEPAPYEKQEALNGARIQEEQDVFDVERAVREMDDNPNAR